MNVNGEEILPSQIAAGLAAMRGEFRAHDVRAALARAGVENTDRAADRLMQVARKKGQIKAITNKVWMAHDA